jgi:hypothetical protein
MNRARGDPKPTDRTRFDPSNDEIVATVTWLRLVDLDRGDGDDPTQALAYLARVTCWCDALRARAVAAAGRVGTAAATGSRDTADVVAGTGVSSRESRRHVRLAEKLEQLPAVADALERGDLSIGHVEAITKAMDSDPAVAAAAISEQDELIARASTESVDAFDQSQKDWTERTAEAAGVSLDARRRVRRKTSFYDDELGMRVLRSVLTPEDSAIVERGIRTLVDEFVRLSRGDKTDRAISPLEHTHQLLSDALVEMARRSLAGGTGRSLPHVIVHVDALTLQTGIRHDGSVLTLDNGTPIAIETVQRMLCDATVTGVLLANLATVAKGRTIRTANDDHWDILRARDGGCVFPECSMPADYCHAHHIRHWTAHHGLTEPDNLVLLCAKHHHLVHEGHWTMRGPAHRLQILTPDGHTFWTRTHAEPAIPSPHDAATPSAPPAPSRRTRLRRWPSPSTDRPRATDDRATDDRATDDRATDDRVTHDRVTDDGRAVVRRAAALAERVRLDRQRSPECVPPRWGGPPPRGGSGPTDLPGRSRPEVLGWEHVGQRSRSQDPRSWIGAAFPHHVRAGATSPRPVIRGVGGGLRSTP